MKTIFTTPVFRELLSLVARAFMRFKGYKITGENPPYDKYVLVCAPHTSNWDFIYMLCVVLSRKMDVRWMGKRQLFPWSNAFDDLGRVACVQQAGWGTALEA